MQQTDEGLGEQGVIVYRSQESLAIRTENREVDCFDDHFHWDVAVSEERAYSVLLRNCRRKALHIWRRRRRNPTGLQHNHGPRSRNLAMGTHQRNQRERTLYY